MQAGRQLKPLTFTPVNIAQAHCLAAIRFLAARQVEHLLARMLQPDVAANDVPAARVLGGVLAKEVVIWVVAQRLRGRPGMTEGAALDVYA